MSAVIREPVFVIVSGPPASGKSTLAPAVAAALGLPLYRRRAGTRHAGHFDHHRTRELWNCEVAEPVAGGWPLLEVDTNEPVDVSAVVQFIRAHIAHE